MSQVTKGKQHSPTSVGFDQLSVESFDTVATIGAGVANTTVQAVVPCATNFKILRASVAYTAIAAATGTHKVNVVVGTGAEAGTAAPNDNYDTSGTYTFATAGQSIAAADVGLTATAGTPQQITPDNPDAIYQAGSLLTLRVVTPASTGSISNLKVQLLIKPYDTLETRPSNAAFNPSTDIP